MFRKAKVRNHRFRARKPPNLPKVGMARHKVDWWDEPRRWWGSRLTNCIGNSARLRRCRADVTYLHSTSTGRPEPVHDCVILNQTSESLSVRCEAGFDGGLAQRFVAELREAAGRRLLRNLTQSQPRFSVRHLPAGLRLRLELYAVNGRGRSEPVSIEGLTLQAAEKRISNDAGGSGGRGRGGERMKGVWR